MPEVNDKLKERWPEMDIRFLVLEADTFIVCIDSELDVDWNTNIGFQGLDDETRHHEILNRTALLESLPIYSLPEQIRLSYKRMLGEAIARSLSDDYQNASKALDSAEEFINARNGELARSWYLFAGGEYAFLIVIAGLLLWFGRNEAMGLMGDTLFWLAIAAVAGAVGALFSIIMRMGKSNLDCSAGKRLHQLESVSRITAGMISAIIIALAIYRRHSKALKDYDDRVWEADAFTTKRVHDPKTDSMVDRKIWRSDVKRTNTDWYKFQQAVKSHIVDASTILRPAFLEAGIHI